MAVSFYILAGYIKPNQRSNEAAVKYFLLGAFSLGILLYGMSLMYGLSGTTNLRVMALAFVGQERDPRLVLAVILVVAGIGFKIAAVPFHMWAPDVYEGAPTPITAFLSVGSKAASFAMLIRIFVEGMPSMSADWRLLFYVLSILTMTAGNIAAVTQSNVKRMLAYSSIAHAGYLLIGVVAGTARGITAMLVYLMIYAFMQLGAFAVVALLRRTVVPQPVRSLCDADLHAVARRHSPDRGLHGQVLAVQRRHRLALLRAGGHRRAQQRDLALLLRADCRVHVFEEGHDRIRAGHQPRARHRPRRCGGRDAVAGRLSAGPVRGCRRVGPDAGRGGHLGRNSLNSW
jgi:hypothetical protein